MSNFVFTEAKEQLLQGLIDFSSDDIRCMLVMSNTTADTDDGTGVDAVTMGDITLDELVASGYTTNGFTLTGEAVTKDSPNNRGEFDAGDPSWTALATAVRQVQAAIIYKWDTDQASSLPIAYIDTGGFPFDGGGADVTIQWNAEGILQTT